MNKTKLLLTATLLFSASLFAQTKDSSYTFTLQQAVDYAYQHQKNVVNAQLDEKIAIAKVKETTGIGLPQVNASFDAKDYFALNYLFPGQFAGLDPREFVGFSVEPPSY